MIFWKKLAYMRWCSRSSWRNLGIVCWFVNDHSLSGYILWRLWMKMLALQFHKECLQPESGSDQDGLANSNWCVDFSDACTKSHTRQWPAPPQWDQHTNQGHTLLQHIFQPSMICEKEEQRSFLTQREMYHSSDACSWWHSHRSVWIDGMTLFQVQ